MKPDGTAFLDWLHKRREANERERRERGLSQAEWLHRIHVKADEILARLPDQEPASVARDAPATKQPRRRPLRP